MVFQRIDPARWARQEYFTHYFSTVPCTYSMTVKLDATRLRARGHKLFPAMLHCLTTVVNRHEEFRTCFNEEGQLGIFAQMLPCYTVFHPDSETFSNLWTEYTPDLGDFCAAYARDMAEYGARQGLVGKPDVPPNHFPVSTLPWTSFEGFHLHLQKGYDYLLPIFTLGKCYTEHGRFFLPLAVQVHHGVCDGFHVCRFLNELQALMDAE